jgi:cytochrome c556
MTTPFQGAMRLPIPLLALLAAAGCSDSSSGGPAGLGPAAAPPPPAPASAAAGSNPAIAEIMVKMAKGPGSLTSVLGKELKEEQPPWETIQPRAKELAELATALGRQEPKKGSMDSWSKQTSAYAASAAKLDQAVQDKDREAARQAHSALANSCMGCHREHRAMGRGMGGPGFPGRGGPGGRPPGGGPPGGPPPG